MKAVYLPTNLCWKVLCGDNFTSVNGQYSWQTLKELKWDLKMCGLKLNRKKEVVLLEDSPPVTGTDTRMKTINGIDW